MAESEIKIFVTHSPSEDGRVAFSVKKPEVRNNHGGELSYEGSVLALLLALDLEVTEYYRNVKTKGGKTFDHAAKTIKHIRDFLAYLRSEGVITTTLK